MEELNAIHINEEIERLYFEKNGEKINKALVSFSADDISYFNNRLYLNAKSCLNKKAILGIDIYKYSKYTGFKQMLIPVIFNKLFEESIKECTYNELYLFQNLVDIDMVDENSAKPNEKNTFDRFNSEFISTGDGGFLILPTPYHAVIFALYFQSQVKLFNGYRILPVLREYLGELNLRFTLTYGEIFSFKKSYYGPSIIRNARVLGKDKLNRMLIDKETNDWFQKRIINIENITNFSLDMLKNNVEPFNTSEYSKITAIHEADKDVIHPVNKDNIKISPSLLLWSEFFWKSIPMYETINKVTKNFATNIRTATLLKIGQMKSKGDSLDLHSIYIEADLRYYHEQLPSGATNTPIRITIGNLNTAGLESLDYK